MRAIVAVFLLMAADAAHAGGVTRNAPSPEVKLIGNAHNAAATAANIAGARVPPGKTAIVQAVVTIVTVGSGGGASSTVFRVSDGTNSCDATMACTASQATGTKVVDVTGACTFAGGSTLILSIVSSGCTSTNPTLRNIEAVGILR